MEHKISRDALVQDIRELSNLLEDAHPDPYVNGGGKIGYNRRLQKLIRDVPSGYKKIFTLVKNEKAIIVPENTKDMHPEEMQKLRDIPYIRLILKKDLPEDLLTKT